MVKARLAVLAVVALVATAACGDDETTSPPGPPANVAGVSGDNQTAVVGTALTSPIAVRVTDASGRGVGGVDVVFDATSGGGDVSAAIAGGLAGNIPRPQLALAVTVQTDNNGNAEADWTLGTQAGSQEATATVSGLDPVTFTAAAQPDVADAVALATGDAQEGLLGSALDEDLVIQVTDQYNNAVPGETVNWSVTQGDANLGSATSTTDVNGHGFNTLTLGQTAGEIEVTATVGSFTPVTFTALAKAELADPSGDEFSTGLSTGLVPPDITRLTAWREGTDLKVELAFVENVVSNLTGGPNVVIGILDIDTDQNAATGGTPATDNYRPGAGSTGMGQDYSVAILANASGEFSVFDFNGTSQGTFTPDFTANVLTMTIPLSLLGDDDGIVYLATVVGTTEEPTDIAPNDGNLATGPAPGPVAGIHARPKDTRPARWPGATKN